MERLFPGIGIAADLHPAFVHFPIALWLASALFWVLGAAVRRESLISVGRWLLYLGTAGALVALATGLRAEARLGHDSPGHDLVHTHRDLMIVATSLGAAASVAAFFLRRASAKAIRWALALAVVATSLVTLAGADRGALLVYGYGIGTRGLTPPETHDDHEHDRDHDHADVDEARSEVAPAAPESPPPPAGPVPIAPADDDGARDHGAHDHGAHDHGGADHSEVDGWL